MQGNNEITQFCLILLTFISTPLMIFIYIFPLDGSLLVKIPTAAKRGLISWWPCLHGSHKLRQKFAVVAKGSKGVKWRDKWGALVYMTADSRGHKESRPTANTLMTGSSLKALQVSTWVAQMFHSTNVLHRNRQAN